MLIDLDTVLWRTRGQTWDYQIILCPTPPHIETWYDFCVDAFDSVIPHKTPKTFGGVLVTLNKDKINFIATVFQDPMRKDAIGRPVTHYMVYFPTPEHQGSKISRDWGIDVVQAFGDHWTKAFTEKEPLYDKFIDVRSQVKEVLISTVAGDPLQFEYQIHEKKKCQVMLQTSKLKPFPWLMTIVVGIILIILLALLYNKIT